jgi:hypothetical protein
MRFWPSAIAARASLLSLMAFAFLMAVLLASTIPPWWGPDEDYHWSYAANIANEGSLPNPKKPFYSLEWNEAIVAEDFNQFGMAPAGPTALTGDPHALDRKFERKNRLESRLPTGEPTRPVVHAPLFHVSAAAAMRPFAAKSIFTRLWIGRVVNAFIALLIVFAAWVLAAQVFQREGPRLFVAMLAATQPMINYATGTMTNDAVMIAFFTFSLAVLVRVFSDPPSRRLGILAGTFVGLALISKSSALLLVPLTALAFGVQALRHRDLMRRVLTSAAVGAGICFLIAGWFYLYLQLKYGSMTGSLGALNTPAAPGTERGLTALPSLAKRWFAETYSTYWFHFVYWEGPRGNAVFYMPFVFGMIGLSGLAAWVWRVIRTRGFGSLRLQQAVLLLGVVLLAISPWFFNDMLRGLSANGFAFNGGRFIMPTYPAAAVLFTIGVAELVRRRNQVYVFALLAGVSFWVAAEVWKLKVLDRYFGGAGQTLGSELERASFFRPEWVTQGFLSVLMVLVALAAASAWFFGIRAALVERRAESDAQ